jgi:hypothetical protein
MLTSLAAILGGVITLAGLVDSLLYHGSRSLGVRGLAGLAEALGAAKKVPQTLRPHASHAGGQSSGSVGNVPQSPAPRVPAPPPTLPAGSPPMHYDQQQQQPHYHEAPGLPVSDWSSGVGSDTNLHARHSGSAGYSAPPLQMQQSAASFGAASAKQA